MFLLNLTWLQLFAVFGGLSVGVVALYLWDRSKRRVAVPTLRFWQPAERAAEVKHRKRIQQPLSLLLQLAGILLLLLALAQPRLGGRGAAARDHVLILDTSAWMAANSESGTLMDHAQALARAYVRALPAGDRLMLLRADALTTPATAFERNRAVLEQAIVDSHAGATALDLGQAIDFARQAQRLQGGKPGEIVYAGTGRTTNLPAELVRGPAAGIRVLTVADAVSNCGLRRMGVRRSTGDSDEWEILVAIRNYGARPQPVTLALAFSGSPAGSRRLTLAPSSEQNVAFQYRARGAGVLEAKLFTNDAFPADDRASLELPAQRALNVVVYSDQPDMLRPALAANPLVKASFHHTSEYRPEAAADVLIFDRFNPPAPPRVDAVWIEPPAEGSPVRLRSTVSNAELTRWRSDHPLAAGLRAKDMRLESAEVFASSAENVSIAEVAAGPVIVAHAEKPKFVVLGFHPVRGALRYELTTPLLFANILRWMAPDIFRRWELNAGSPGTITTELGSEAEAGSVRVIAENGTELPYTVEGRNLRFFAGTPGTVRVVTADSETVFSFTLPELADTKWIPPAGTRRGVPRTEGAAPTSVELWPWLALAGALVLVIEWMLFGRGRYGASAIRRTAPAGSVS